MAERAVGDVPGATWWTGEQPTGTWRTWDEALGALHGGATLTRHATATSVPRRLAGTFVASTLVCALARLQSICLTILQRQVAVEPSTLRIDVTDGQVAARLGLPSGQLVPADPGAPPVDALIERCVDDLSAGGRVSARVVACDAAFAWLAGVRSSLPFAERSSARDLLRAQWSSRYQLEDLVVEHRVPSSVNSEERYLSRAVCCLEYQTTAAERRTYCPSCPLVPAEAIVARRAAVVRGERPRPFDDRDRAGRGQPALSARTASHPERPNWS